MEWINVNEKYLDFLREFEHRIPKTDYGSNRYKPFFGTLFEKENYLYITQVSHAQDRHKKMKVKPDFFKIYDPKNHERLIAVINLNYMFPIHKNEVTSFKKSEIEKYRTFKTEKEKSKYISLLDTEMKVIRTLDLTNAAKNVYDIKIKFPNSKLALRCLDFIELENYGMKWKSM